MTAPYGERLKQSSVGSALLSLGRVKCENTALFCPLLPGSEYCLGERLRSLSMKGIMEGGFLKTPQTPGMARTSP